MKPKKSSQKSSTIFSLRNITKRLKAKASPKNDNCQTSKSKSTSLTYIKPFNNSSKKVFVEIEMKTFKDPVKSTKELRSPSDSPRGTLETKWLIASTEDFRKCSKKDSCLSNELKSSKKQKEKLGFKKNEKIKSKIKIDLKDQKINQSKIHGCIHSSATDKTIYPSKNRSLKNIDCSESIVYSDVLHEILRQNKNEVVKIERDKIVHCESDLIKPLNPFKNDQSQSFKSLHSPVKQRRSIKRFFSKSKTSIVSRGQKIQLDRRNSSPHPKSDNLRKPDEREMQTFLKKNDVKDSESPNIRGDSEDLSSYKSGKDGLCPSPEVTFTPLSSNLPIDNASKSILKSIKSCFKTQESSEKMISNTMLTPIGPVIAIKDDSISKRKTCKSTLKYLCSRRARAIDLCGLEFLKESEDSLFKPGKAKIIRCSYPDCRDFSNNSKLMYNKGANQSASSNQVVRTRKNSKVSTSAESRGDCFFSDRKSLSVSSGAKNSQSVRSMGRTESSQKNVPIGKIVPPKPSASEVVQNSTLIKPIRSLRTSKCNSKQKSYEIDNLETSGPIFENFFAAERQGRNFHNRESNGKFLPKEFTSKGYTSNENIVKMLDYQDSKTPVAKYKNKGVLKKYSSVTPPIIKRKKGLINSLKSRLIPNSNNSTDAFKNNFLTPAIRECRKVRPLSETQSLFSWQSKQSKKVLHVPNSPKCGRGRGRPLGMRKMDKKRPETKPIGRYMQAKECSRRITKNHFTQDENLKDMSSDTIRSNQISSIGRGRLSKYNILSKDDSGVGLGSEILQNLERWRGRNSPCFLHELMQSTDQKPVINKTGQNMKIIMEEKFSRNVVDKEVAIVFTICLEDYRILGKIADGNFGKIMFAKSISMDKKFALKMIEKNYIIGMQDQRIVDEKFRNKFVPNIVNVCPFFVHLLDIFQTESHFFYVMEFMEYCNLELILLHTGCFANNQIRFYSAGILLAIKYLHEQKLIHRNLKLENVLIDSKGYPRLSDFGKSCFRIQSGSKFDEVCTGLDQQDKWTNIQYMAPEVLTGRLHNQMVDFWSLAVCMVYMLTGQLQKNWRYFVDYLDEINSMYSHTTMNLLKSMTKLNPSLRLGFGDMGAMQVMNHPFFEIIDWPVYSMKSYVVPLPNKNCRTGHSVMSKEVYDELASSIGMEKNYKAAIVSVAPYAPPLNREIDLLTSQFKTSLECHPDGKCIKVETIEFDKNKSAEKNFSFVPPIQQPTMFMGPPIASKQPPPPNETINILKPMENRDQSNVEKKSPEPPCQGKEKFNNCLTQLLERMQSELHLYHSTVGPLPLLERKKVDEKEVLDRLMKLHRLRLCNEQKKKSEPKIPIQNLPTKSYSTSTLGSKTETQSSLSYTTSTASGYSSSTLCQSESYCSDIDSTESKSVYDDASSSRTEAETASASTVSSVVSQKRSNKKFKRRKGGKCRKISFADQKESKSKYDKRNIRKKI